MALLSDTGSVIDALGGTHAVAKIFHCDMRRVSNWRAVEYFPPETFETFCREMAARGIGAPLSLWRQIPTSQLERITIIGGTVGDVRQTAGDEGVSRVAPGPRPRRAKVKKAA